MSVHEILKMDKDVALGQSSLLWARTAGTQKELVNMIGCCQATGVTSVFLLLVRYFNKS